MTAPPIVTSEQEKSIITRERLRLLTIGYYIQGGQTALFSLLFLVYLALLMSLSFIPKDAWKTDSEQVPSPAPALAPPKPSDNAGPDHGEESVKATRESAMATPSPRQKRQDSSGPPVMIFRFVSLVLLIPFAGSLAMAWLTILAGRCLQKRKHKAFIFVMAVLQVFWFPFGTLVGVATFFVLGSDAGQREFEDA